MQQADRVQQADDMKQEDSKECAARPQADAMHKVGVQQADGMQ